MSLEGRLMTPGRMTYLEWFAEPLFNLTLPLGFLPKILVKNLTLVESLEGCQNKGHKAKIY